MRLENHRRSQRTRARARAHDAFGASPATATRTCGLQLLLGPGQLSLYAVASGRHTLVLPHTHNAPPGMVQIRVSLTVAGDVPS